MIHVAFLENIAHAHAYQMSLQILVAQIKTLPCDRILWRVGPACSETARHGVFSHHRGVSLAVPHSMPRYLRSRRRRSTAVCGTGPYTHGPCLHAPLRRPVMRGDPLRHRTQLPSRENIPLPFTPNTRGGITSGGRAPWISCSGPIWCGRGRRRSAWRGCVWRSSRHL